MNNKQQYTIKELSDIIGCSVPTTTKRLKDFNIEIHKVTIKGRLVSVVNIDKNTLKTLKGDNLEEEISISEEYIKKYFALKEEHIELKANMQLLEDKRKSDIEVYINEVNHLRTQIDNDAQTINNMHKLNKYKNIALCVVCAVLIVCITLLCTKL